MGSPGRSATLEETSNDGKTFNRQLNRSGTVGLFDEGPGSNPRDPMVLPIGDRLSCYYTAYPKGKGAVYCRQSWTDPGDWGPSTVVAFGGRAGTDPFSAECLHVVVLDGYHFLFRTQRYGRDAQTSVSKAEGSAYAGKLSLDGDRGQQDPREVWVE